MKRLAVILFVCFSFSFLQAQDAVTLKNEGNKALTAKQYALAMAKFEKALAVLGNKPADNAMIFAMGTCAYSLNDMKKSLTYIDMTIAAGYNLDMAYQYRVCIMKAQKNSEGYLKTLKDGLAKVPNSKSLKETLGKYYYEEGDKRYHEASDIMKNAVVQVNAGKMATSDKSFQEMNAKARVIFKEALKFLNMSLELLPNDANTKNGISNCQNKMNMLI